VSILKDNAFSRGHDRTRKHCLLILTLEEETSRRTHSRHFEEVSSVEKGKEGDNSKEELR